MLWKLYSVIDFSGCKLMSLISQFTDYPLIGGLLLVVIITEDDFLYD
jgi:hypothetical protein